MPPQYSFVVALDFIFLFLFLIWCCRCHRIVFFSLLCRLCFIVWTLSLHRAHHFRIIGETVSLNAKNEEKKKNTKISEKEIIDAATVQHLLQCICSIYSNSLLLICVYLHWIIIYLNAVWICSAFIETLFLDSFSLLFLCVFWRQSFIRDFFFWLSILFRLQFFSFGFISIIVLIIKYAEKRSSIESCIISMAPSFTNSRYNRTL